MSREHVCTTAHNAARTFAPNVACAMSIDDHAHHGIGNRENGNLNVHTVLHVMCSAWKRGAVQTLESSAPNVAIVVTNARGRSAVPSAAFQLHLLPFCDSL